MSGYVDGLEIIFRKKDCSLPVMPGVTRALPLNMALMPDLAQEPGERRVERITDGMNTSLALKKLVLIPPGVRQVTATFLSFHSQWSASEKERIYRLVGP